MGWKTVLVKDAMAYMPGEPADMNPGGDAWLILVLFFLGAAVLYLVGEFKKGNAAGMKALVVVGALIAASVVFPAAAMFIGGAIFLYSMVRFVMEKI